MPNYKEINWDVIRADYVMDASYPSYDELCRKYGISKPLLIEKANDRNDVINQGFTWIEQREKFTKKKQSVAEDVAITQAKKHINNYIKILNNIGFKSFTILTRELDWIEKQQKKAEEAGGHFSIKGYLKVGDIVKVAEALYKLSGTEGAKELTVKLELAGKQAEKGGYRLQDLTDEELAETDLRIKGGKTYEIEESKEPSSKQEEEENG